jgi:hypothetical protein
MKTRRIALILIGVLASPVAILATALFVDALHTAYAPKSAEQDLGTAVGDAVGRGIAHNLLLPFGATAAIGLGISIAAWVALYANVRATRASRE